MRARIVTGTIPSGGGTVDYTHPDITSWNTKGLALVFVSGNSASESESAGICIGAVDQSGNTRMSCSRMMAGRPNVSDCANANHSTAIVRVLDNTDPLPSIVTWARGDFGGALANGLTINWSDVTGVSGRTFNVVVVLIDGLAQSLVGNGSGAAIGFEPDAVIGLGFSGSIGTFGNVNADAHVTMGAAVDGSPIKQAAIVTAWENAVDAASAGVACDNRYGLDLVLPSTQTDQALDDFTATGFDDTGTGGIMWAALVPTGPETFGVALESLDGGTGSKRFTGLGISSQVVIGIINGNTATNTVQNNTDALSTLCLFVTNGSSTYSMSLSQTRETIGGGNNSNAFSRYTSGSINMLDHTGGTAFVATVGNIAGGIDLEVSTGFTGRMWLFGFGAVAVPIVRRRRPRRARRARRALRRTIVGGTVVSLPPFPRWMKSVLRMRARIRARLRWRPRVDTPQIFEGEPNEDGPKGRVFTSGLVRGRIRSTFEEPE